MQSFVGEKERVELPGEQGVRPVEGETPLPSAGCNSALLFREFRKSRRIMTRADGIRQDDSNGLFPVVRRLFLKPGQPIQSLFFLTTVLEETGFRLYTAG